MNVTTFAFALGLIAFPTAMMAASTEEASEPAASVSQSRQIEDEDEAAPEIRIVTKGRTRYEEYRINGQLYMIKVVPRRGKPYYLVDQTGTGRLVRHSDVTEPFAVPQWVIFKR